MEFSTNLSLFPAPRTSRAWLEHFIENKQAVADMPWELGARMSEHERSVLIASIQAFERGEGSEGRNLYKFCKDYAARENDPEYLECIELFIREEQKHAALLAEYLKRLGVPRLKKTWPDTVFRGLRKQAGLEVSLSVLITAEIIATVYYVALRDATSSLLLKKICERIAFDESHHLHFQAERLALLRWQRSRAALLVTHQLQRTLYAGTCLVVWVCYQPTFRAGGHTFLTFWQTAWHAFNDCFQRMNPRHYAGPSRRDGSGKSTLGRILAGVDQGAQ